MQQLVGHEESNSGNLIDRSAVTNLLIPFLILVRRQNGDWITQIFLTVKLPPISRAGHQSSVRAKAVLFSWMKLWTQFY